MTSPWKRLPVIVRAPLTGLAAAATGAAPWTVLVSANYEHWPSVPWAVVPTALYLWLWCRYMLGKGWPRSTSDGRRTGLRALHLPEGVWGSALLAGGLGLVFMVLLLRVMNRLVSLPPQQLPDLSHIPPLTLLAFLATGSVVAGVVEEASFRGYMQAPIERRHGPVVAILVTGVLFGLAHFTHAEFTWALLPYYLTFAAVLGALAYLTNSILPGMVLHAGGNILGGLDLLAGGRAEWQTSGSPEPLVWQAGADASFCLACAAALVVGTGTIGAYASLARVARKGA